MLRHLVPMLLALCFATPSVAAPKPAAKAKRRRRKQPFVALPGKLILTEDFDTGMQGWKTRGNGKIGWVADGKQPWAGKGCVMGKVERDRRANFLERPADLKANSIYRFACSVRASRPQGKLVMFMYKGKVRRRISDWRNVGRRWRNVQAQFSPPETGKWTLQIVLPSSHGAPPCSMWIDNLKLFETDLPKSTNLTHDQGYSGEPSLAADREGALWISWLSYRKGQDTLMAGQLAPAGDSFKLGRTWPVALPEGSSVLGSTLVAAPAGAWLLYAGEVDGNWDIYAVRLTPSGPAKPTRITTSPAVDALPSGTVVDGKLWVAWESNRDGRRQAYLAQADSPKPLRVSNANANSYAPHVVAHDGELWIAWNAYVRGNYDIYGRRLREGRLSPIERLCTDGNADWHARLASTPSGLWIAWQRDIQNIDPRQTRNYRPGNVATRRSMLCKWTANGLVKAKGWAQTILPQGTEIPTLAVDGQGRIWVTARRARGRPGWDSVLQCFAGNAWGDAHHLSSQLGWDGRAGIAIANGRVVVAYQVGKTQAFPDYEASFVAKSNVKLATLPLSQAPPAAAPLTEPLADSTAEHGLAKLRTELGEEAELPRTITYNGETLHLYFGDLHEHSSISQCNRWRDISPNDSYCYERDIINADFTALTDHGYNFCPALWHKLSKVVRINHDPGRFVAFLAEEWTSSFEKYSDKYPAGYYGHHNLIFEDATLPRWWNARDGKTPAQVWTELRKRKESFVVIPHQLADTGNVPVAWEFNDETAQPVAEIFQARQSYEYKGAPRQARNTIDGCFLQDAWAKGIVIGVIASPDHGGGQGKACVYAKAKTREAILDALRARRCYGTSAARIFMDVRVNGRLMGEKITAKKGRPVTITAKVVGANNVDRVDLCRNNVFIYSKPAEGREVQFSFRDEAPLEGASYYYVRVQQKDSELAWSSPVWVTMQ